MKTVRNLYKNKKGSALAITAVMVIVLALLVSVLLTLASFALNQAYAMYARQQAYFSARSAVLQFKDYLENGDPSDPDTSEGFTNFRVLAGRTITADVTIAAGEGAGLTDPHFGEVEITIRKVNTANHETVGKNKYKVTAVGSYSLGDTVYQNAASVYVFDDYEVKFSGNRNMVSASSSVLPNGGNKINMLSPDFDKTLEDTMTHIYCPKDYLYESYGSVIQGYLLAGDVTNFSIDNYNSGRAKLQYKSNGSGYADRPDNYGVYVNGDFEALGSGWYIDGDVYCSGSFSMPSGNGLTITGNLYVGENCSLSSGVRIDGSLYVGGNLNISGNGIQIGSTGASSQIYVAGTLSESTVNTFKWWGSQINGNSGVDISDWGGKDFTATRETIVRVLTEKILNSSSTYEVDDKLCETEKANLQPLNFKYDSGSRSIYIDESGIFTADMATKIKSDLETNYGLSGGNAANYFERNSDWTLVVDTGYSSAGTQKTIILYIDDDVTINMFQQGTRIFQNIGVIGDGQLIVMLGDNAHIMGGNKGSGGNYLNAFNFGYLSNGDGLHRAMTLADLPSGMNKQNTASYVSLDALYKSLVSDEDTTEYKKAVLKDIEPEIYIIAYSGVAMNNNKENANVYFEGMNYTGFIVTSDNIPVAPNNKNSAVVIDKGWTSGCIFSDTFWFPATGESSYSFIPPDTKFQNALITPGYIKKIGGSEDLSVDPENKKVPVANSKLFTSGGEMYSKKVGATNQSNYDGVSSAFFSY